MRMSWTICVSCDSFSTILSNSATLLLRHTFALLCQERAAGRHRVTLDIAYDVADTLASEITAAVVEQAPERLIVQTHIKPELLGGFRVLLDDKLYDYSTVGAMRRLQKRMMTSSLGKD